MTFYDLSYEQQCERLQVAAQQALARYGLSGARLELIAYVSNAVFRVTHSSGRFALRLHLPGRKPAAWVRSELLWLMALNSETDVYVPTPVLTSDGALLSEAKFNDEDPPLFCSLFGWIEGEFWTQSLRDEQAVMLGRVLARLHCHAARFDLPAGFARPRLDVASMFGSGSPYYVHDDGAVFTAAQRELFAAVEARVQTVMHELGESAQHFGLIHGDFLAKNYLFTTRGIAVIDFDDCA
ncbi:MAG: phosphotransferase, partial [Anaerolineae bacterium]|nr:phosphotransferase [Anaerolineae bacterium]